MRSDKNSSAFDRAGRRQLAIQPKVDLSIPESKHSPRLKTKHTVGKFHFSQAAFRLYQIHEPHIMRPMMKSLSNHTTWQPALKILLILVTLIVLFTWLALTPAGLLGKADAIGYSVCHRIAVRSFLLGDRQLPLCARCSGMYLGALLAMVYLGSFGRKGGLPPLRLAWVLGLFVVAFGIDGVNSYLHFFPSAPWLYNPENWLRLVTGTGMGLGLGAVVVAVVHQTLWQNYDPQPALNSWRRLLLLIVMAGVLDWMIWSENPLLLFPLAVLSSATVLLILTLVYTVVWTLISKQDNRFESLRQVWVAGLAGFLTALLQIAVIDAGRFLLTGTWGGFNL